MNCYEMVTIIITTLGIIIAAFVTNRNTNKQIRNINKENNKPILFIDKMELISTHDSLDNCNLYFEKYLQLQEKELLINRTIANGPSTIRIDLSNAGTGLAKNISIFNKNNGSKVNYFVSQSNDKWIKKGNVLLVPNGKNNSIELVPQYIREQKLVDDEYPCSDYSDIRIYYSDINNNFYSLDVRLEIKYFESKKEFNVEYYSNDVFECNIKTEKKKYRNTDLSAWTNQLLKQEVK